MSIESALIFAAGFGTRMGELTKDTPKPMLQVRGKPLIDYAYELVSDMDTIVVNLHYFPEQIEDYLASRQNVKTLREAPEILETGGGLKNALPLLGNNPVVTLNSDAVWTGDNPITALRKAWNPTKMDALLMLVLTANAQEHKGAGDFNLNANGTISRRGKASRADYVYSGAQIIKTDALSDIQETSFSLNRLWDKMLKEERVYAIAHNGGWVDVGRPEGIVVAETELENHV